MGFGEQRKSKFIRYQETLRKREKEVESLRYL